MRPLGLGILCAALATPAMAECLGDGCYAGAGAFLLSLLAYFVLAIVLLVLLFRRKARAFLMALGIAAAIAVGVPLLSWGYVGWKNLNLAQTEMVGEGPSLAGETVVHIHSGGYCGDNTCEAVARYSGADFVAGVTLAYGATVDFSQPIDLSTLIVTDVNTEAGYARRPPWADVVGSPDAEILAQMAGATRVVITQGFYYARPQGPLEQALMRNPQFAQMGSGETIALAIGRLHEPGVLDLSQVEFQYIDLTLQTQYRTIPLMFGDGLRSVPFRMTPEQRDILEPVLCVGADEWTCDDMLGRQWNE